MRVQGTSWYAYVSMRVLCLLHINFCVVRLFCICVLLIKQSENIMIESL